jgi:hypothetical protein
LWAMQVRVIKCRAWRWHQLLGCVFERSQVGRISHFWPEHRHCTAPLESISRVTEFSLACLPSVLTAVLPCCAGTQCPYACIQQDVTISGSLGADGMASVIAHEFAEAVSNPLVSLTCEIGSV